MSALAEPDDALIRAFQSGLPTSDLAKQEVYISAFLATTPLRSVLVASAELESARHLGFGIAAREVARKCCANAAGARQVAEDGEVLQVLVAGVRHPSAGVRTAALTCFEAAFSALGDVAVADLAGRDCVAEALARGLVDDEVAVADAATKTLLTVANKGAFAAALVAIDRARAATTDSTHQLRCCDAIIRIACVSQPACDAALPRVEETMSIARGETDDALLQLNALELVAQLGASPVGARALLGGRGETLAALIHLARGGGDALFADVLADAAMSVLARVLQSCARGVAPEEWAEVRGDRVEAFFELAIDKFGHDSKNYVATVEALGAFASASGDVIDAVVSRGDLARAWLAESPPGASVDARAARLRSIASCLQATQAPQLWAAFVRYSEPRLLLKSAASPHHEVRCAALELLGAAAPLALRDLAQIDGFYEWLARPAVETEPCARAIELKHAVLEASVDAAMNAQPPVFNEATIDCLQVLRGKGAYYVPHQPAQPQVHLG